MREKTHWVHDYETLSNCFLAVFEDIKSDHQEIFVCHSSRNDILEFITFLERNIALQEWHVSFNGLGFDSQITEYILRAKHDLLEMDGESIARYVYDKAQRVIQKQSEGEFLEFSPRDLQIRQVDVFKLNHWDNPAKRSSLKWIQFSMDWHNIMDMPIHHSTEIKANQIPEIIEYCSNDVKSTKAIMLLSKGQIELRKNLTSEYNIDLFSASEPRISKELFLMFLSDQTGIKKWELRQMRTSRDKITVNDIILPYIKFKTATFQNLLKKFKEVVIYPGETKGGFKYSVQYRGVKTDYGLGGIHGARASRVYKSTEDMVIITSDVKSFYPNLAIRNGWAPAHLPQEIFCNQYEWFYDERVKIPKKDPKNYVYKIILNSTYGLSNDKNCFLYDPEFTMRITINGQLSLTMLYEMILEEIPEAVPLMQNTDGLETLVPRHKVDRYMEICAEWEKITMLELEHDSYSKIVLGDVNNYIAVTEDGKSKCKGRFEYKDLALHKNKSFLIIPKALHAYFVDGIKPEDFLAANQNVFDYCGGVKIKGDWKFVEHSVVDKNYNTKDLQHTIRYYISNSGSKIVKTNLLDGREIQVESGKWLQTVFIDYAEKPFEDYNINYEFYLEKIRKEIAGLEPQTNQLSLF
ncbi:MAG: hypothetical protein NTY55_02630 [Flavobacteriia bacterium]|nr:hypothetical protein [Flavobacteriia bacterium]